jgi:hypothetical protein
MNETNEAAQAAEHQDAALEAEHAEAVATLQAPDVPDAEEEDLPEPVALARETLFGDICALVVDEFKALPDVWQKLPQNRQDQVLGRVASRVREAVNEAVRMIDSDGRDVIEATLEQVTIKDGIKGVVTLPKHADCRHALMDAVGKTVLLVVSEPTQYLGGQAPKSEPDQRALKLEADAAQGDGDGMEAAAAALEASEPAAPAVDEGVAAAFNLAARQDPLLRACAEEIARAKPESITPDGLRKLVKIGREGAARVLEALADLGLLSGMDAAGGRLVLAQALDAVLAATDQPHAADAVGDVIGDAVEHLRMTAATEGAQ